jgi:hypothetical protein
MADQSKQGKTTARNSRAAASAEFLKEKLTGLKEVRKVIGELELTGGSYCYITAKLHDNTNNVARTTHVGFDVVAGRRAETAVTER